MSSKKIQSWVFVYPNLKEIEPDYKFLSQYFSHAHKIRLQVFRDLDFDVYFLTKSCDKERRMFWRQFFHIEINKSVEWKIKIEKLVSTLEKPSLVLLVTQNKLYINRVEDTHKNFAVFLRGLDRDEGVQGQAECIDSEKSKYNKINIYYKNIQLGFVQTQVSKHQINFNIDEPKNIVLYIQHKYVSDNSIGSIENRICLMETALNILSAYNCEVITSELNYTIIAFDNTKSAISYGVLINDILLKKENVFVSMSIVKGVYFSINFEHNKNVKTGQAINKAARLSKLCGKRQIIIDDRAFKDFQASKYFEIYSEAFDLQFSEKKQAQLKGYEGPIFFYCLSICTTK